MHRYPVIVLARKSAIRRLGASSCARREHGQALILAVICLLVLGVAFFVVFDTGQAVTKKVQLVNAADAAVYSVGIEQARALNTIAYFNRAEVANQIVIAQMVTMQSYGNYADSLVGRTAAFLWDIGYIGDCCGVGEIIQGAAEGIKAVQTVVAQGLIVSDKFETVLVSVLDGLNGIYSAGQDVVVEAFSLQAGLTTADNVIQQNTLDADGYSHAKIPVAGKSLLAMQLACFAGASFCAGPSVISGNKGYAVRYTIPQARGPSKVRRTWGADRVANVMMEARDLFSKQRDGRIPISPLPLVKITAYKKGGTDLVDYNRWVAADDISVDVKFGPCVWFLPCWKFNGLTLGLGAAAALPSNFRSYGNSRSIISPGVSLTKGHGTADNYRPGNGSGWHSPYDGRTRAPYEGTLNNLAWGADLARNPTDQNNFDFIADLRFGTPWETIVPSDATPRNVAWIYSAFPSASVLGVAVHSNGLQDYNDVKPGKALEPYQTSSKDIKDVGPVFTVFVQQQDNTIRTGAKIGMEGGDMKLKSEGVGNSVSAMSSAQVYYDRPMDLAFMRPTGRPAKRELGNLFEPYWQVRLVPTPNPIRVALVGSQLAGM